MNASSGVAAGKDKKEGRRYCMNQKSIVGARKSCPVVS